MGVADELFDHAVLTLARGVLASIQALVSRPLGACTDFDAVQ